MVVPGSGPRAPGFFAHDWGKATRRLKRMELDKVTLLRAKALLGVMLFVLGQISFGLLAGLVIVGEHAAELLIGGALLAQLIGIAGLRMSRLARSRVASLGLAGDSGY